MVRSNVLCLRCINCLLLYFTVFVFGCECVYRVGSGIPLSELYQSFQFRKSSLLRTHGVFTYRFWTNSHCIHSHMAVTVFFKSCGAASLYAKMLTIPPTHPPESVSLLQQMDDYSPLLLKIDQTAFTVCCVAPRRTVAHIPDREVRFVVSPTDWIGKCFSAFADPPVISNPPPIAVSSSWE